jgi:tellurite resistance protein TerC
MFEALGHSVASGSLWVGFIVGVVALLFLDLWVFRGGAKKVSAKQGMLESGLWILTALIFNAFFAWHYGSAAGIEFLTSYLVEKSLSVDNLFVILLIFDSIRVPHQYRHEVLFYGILGAIVMRGLLILLGVNLIQLSHVIFYFFGLILIVTAIRFLRDSDGEHDVKKGAMFRFLTRICPISNQVNGKHFFVLEGGKKKATPLFVALVLIEMSDLVFALDSVPAVLAITQDVFIAFASNILAILGLRALYFVIADWIARLTYLKPGLATILGFIGVKMLIADFYPIPNWVSLLVIVTVLTTAGLTSWYSSKYSKNPN